MFLSGFGKNELMVQWFGCEISTTAEEVSLARLRRIFPNSYRAGRVSGHQNLLQISKNRQLPDGD